MDGGEPRISNRIERAINIALQKARESNHHIFKHCSLIIDRSGIISIALNEGKKTSTMPNRAYGISDKQHAEMRAVRYAGVKAKGATLVSIRAGRRGLSISKPCDGCMEEIRKAGIKTIVYSDGLKICMEKVIK